MQNLSKKKFKNIIKELQFDYKSKNKKGKEEINGVLMQSNGC